MAGLKLVGIDKLYPSGTMALRKVSFELADKEFVAVVGGEKSGKSTLLKVIAGLEEATEGQVIIDGKDVTEVDPKDRDIAMIFRNDTLYPSLNVYDNMSFGLRLRKAPHALIDARVKTVAEILGLTECLYKKPKTLTAAQRQKVAIGRAIVREPRLYLFDDPIAGLDGELKMKMRNVIVNLQARMNGSFVYAAKNVNEALSMATRLIVLREGFVQQIDTPKNLYDYPANAYVAFLIGSPTINFINDAKIVKDGENYFAEYGSFKIALSDKVKSRFANVDEYAGTDKKVILGIRPEDIKAEAGGAYQATVAATEEIAGRKFADCDTGDGLSFVMETDAAKGDKVSFTPDKDGLYIFDSVSRLSLLSRDGGYTETGFADAAFVPLPYDEEQSLVEKSKFKPKDKKKK